MPYVVVWKRAGEVLGSTPWGGTFSSAKEHAIEHYPILAKQQNADCVQVLDDNERVCFSYPRLLRKAP